VTIVKSIIEGVNYRYDDGSNTKDLIKELKLLPRSVKEATVRVNHYGKDFIRNNISKAKQEHHATAEARIVQSHHLHTTHTLGSPSQIIAASPASPSQLDPFITLIPAHRQSQAREAAQVFNSSAQHSFDFQNRHSLPKSGHVSLSPSQVLHSPDKRNPIAESRPTTAAVGSPSEGDIRRENSESAKASRKKTEDLRTEMLFKRLTQENPGILEKIKNMYIARNFTKQGASGYQPRKENYMQMSNNDAIDMLRKKIAQKLHSGPGELRRSFELFDRDGSGKVDIAELSEVLGMFNINLPPDQVFSLMCQFGASDGEIDFNTFIKTVLAPVKIIETQRIGRKAAKMKGRSFLVSKNWLNMHNDQVIAYLRPRVYQL
jgi:Ca2+-binding EF-hand superfamily protein